METSDKKKKLLIEELRRCKSDPEYFISKYIKVVHPIRGMVPFALYPFQGKILHDLHEHRFNILRKFRQAGCTTIASAYSLWFILFHKHKTVVILSKGDSEAVEVLDRIKIMYDELPEFFRQGVKIKTKNAHTLELVNNSVIKSRPSGKESGRGLSASLLIIDEAAFIEYIDTIWAAVYPTISTGGRAFVLSTVNGIGNWYHEIYEGAVEGRNSFNAIDIRWQDHPEYHYHPDYEHLYEEMEKHGLDIHKWEENTRSNISNKKWLQEYECSFLGTGETYVDGEILREVSNSTSSEFRNKYRKRMRIWKDPEPHYTYLIACDCSLGREKDYSAFQIINLYNGEVVAEFYSNKTPINDFAKIINEVGLAYNTAYVAPERNTIGHNLLDWLWNHFEYENIWFDEKDEMGVLITAKNREQILADMEEALRTNSIKINSHRTVDELMSFIITDSGRVEADKNKHDDLVMSLAIGVHVMKKIRETTPMDFVSRVNKDEDLILPSSSYRSNLTTAMGDISDEDYKWLMK